LTGSCALVFDIAQSAWLPALLDRTHLMDGNSKLELSRWSLQISGPGVAGALVQIVGAPFALAADAASFLASALLLATIRTDEAHVPQTTTSTPNAWQEMRAGLRLVLMHRTIRALGLTAAVSNLFAYMQAAELVLYLTRDLS